MDWNGIERRLDDVVERITALVHQKIVLWAEYVLFTGRWWFGVALSIFPWVLWAVLRPRESTDRLLFVGFFIMGVTLSLDLTGDQLGLWHYRYNVVPFLPTYFPWDLTLYPVTILFLLQVKPGASPFWKGLLFAAVTAFAAEPFFVWVGIYHPIYWRYIYSFPLHFLIYLLSHWLSRRGRFTPLV